MMPMTAIVALAGLTYGLRLAGPLLRGRVTVPAAAERLFADAATVLLIALAATSALTVWPRVRGLGAAGRACSSPGCSPRAARRSPSWCSPPPGSPRCCAWPASP